jgi:hypothetical protein
MNTRPILPKGVFCLSLFHKQIKHHQNKHKSITEMQSAASAFTTTSRMGVHFLIASTLTSEYSNSGAPGQKPCKLYNGVQCAELL